MFIMSDLKKKHIFILGIIMVFLLIPRLYHLDVAPLENEESWRQADTESIARNFLEYDDNILRPNFNYDGPLPNIPALEFQVTTFIIAVLYKIFGVHYYIARLVPVFFYMTSAVYLFLYAKKHLGLRKAAFSLIVYGILPVNVYFSRAIMPEAAGLMFILGSFFYFDQWIDKPSWKRIIWCTVFFTLALVTKPPTVFFLFPMLYICWQKFGLDVYKQKELWFMALFAGSLSLGYYIFSNSAAEFHFVRGITNDLLLKRIGTAFYSAEAWEFFKSRLPETMTSYTLYLLPLGAATIRKKDKAILVLFLSMSAEVLFIVSTIRSAYYLIFFAIPISLLTGSFLGWLSENRFLLPAALLLVILIGYNSYQELKPMYVVNESMREEVRLIKLLTSEDDLLVAGAIEPCVLSLSGRRGWRFQIGIYNEVPQDPREELEFYIQSGAKYFIPIQGKIYGDEDGHFFDYLVQTYEKIEPVKGYPFFKLR